METKVELLRKELAIAEMEELAENLLEEELVMTGTRLADLCQGENKIEDYVTAVERLLLDKKIKRVEIKALHPVICFTWQGKSK